MAHSRAREYPDPFRRPSNADTINSNFSSDDEVSHARRHPVPIHPLPSMQEPFEESMLDATGESQVVPFRIPNITVELRQQIICKDADARELDWNCSYSCHWRHHPKGKYHPLSKTISQITFGVHLLHQHLEKSVADVAEILLKHVNELDGFLQRASEDIDSSLKDMLFRRKCLKVPMEHVSEFDRLLDDRLYRAQLLDGNITIERTINRMSQLLNDYMFDMSTFKEANSELEAYLGNIGDEWMGDNEDMARIYTAMCGNTTGWAQFLQSLIAKSEKFGVVLVQVSSYCNEIEKRCGAASRRSLIASRSSSRNSNLQDSTRAFHGSSDNKPLPTTPHQRLPLITLSSPTRDSMIPRSKHVMTGTAGNEGPFTDQSSTDSIEKHGQMTDLSEYFKDTPPPATPKDDNFERRLPPRKSAFFDDNSSQRSEDEQQQHPGSRRNSASESDSGDTYFGAEEGEERIAPRMPPLKVRSGAQTDGSPPLTAKDSAYSSAAVSFNSPAGHPRPFPRAQLGLFPSSQPETPRYIAFSRNASTSQLPTLDSRATSQQRSYSVMGSHPTSRGLLKKKPSLASLKKFFYRKRGGAGNAIRE